MANTANASVTVVCAEDSRDTKMAASDFDQPSIIIEVAATAQPAIMYGRRRPSVDLQASEKTPTIGCASCDNAKQVSAHPTDGFG